MSIDSERLSELVCELQSAQSQVDPCSGTNHQVFAEIFSLLHTPLYDYALRLSGDKDLAEDIVAETMMKLYQNVGRVDPERVFSWSMKVVLNSFRSLWRKERRFCHIESVPERDLVVKAVHGSAIADSDFVLEKVVIQRALDGLSSFEKKIVEGLRRGHSVIEVAKQCGKHRVTIYRHIDSIKEKLTQSLGGELVGEFRIPTPS
jgi:RNA polymerase sigma factor (sigma-70 family)